MKLKLHTLTKINRPIFSEVLIRKRLFRLLDADRQHSAVWISGPPGSGKTVLASSFIESRSLPCLWYQVDCRDADAATFFYYMGLAARNASPRSKPALPLLTQEYTAGLPAFTRNYFENLYCSLRAPSYIVFDNYQDAPADARIHEAIREGIEFLPKGLYAIFISRAEPPKVFSRLITNNLLKVIDSRELALTLEECREMLRFKLKSRYSKEEAGRLHHVTNGWVAGVALMAGKDGKDAPEPDRLRAVADDRLFEYFASEILDKLDTATRKFVLRTSVLPVMDVGMAEQLTASGRAGRMLLYLFRNNHFIERRFHTGYVYQYHPLFREFLLRSVRERLTGEFPILQKKAALILYRKGRFEDAFTLFLDSYDWEWIERLVMEYARPLIDQGRCRVLEEWIRSIPEDMIRRRPWLQYYLGICLMHLNASGGRMHLEKAFLLFAGQKDRAGVFLSWSGIVDSCVFGLNNLKLLDKWIPMLQGLESSFGGFPSREIEARVALSMFMALTYRQPQHPEIESWASRVHSLSERFGDIRLKTLALSNYAFHKMNSGRLEEAAAAIDSCRQSIDATPLAVLTTKWVEAMYLAYTAAHADCTEVVSSGLDISSSTGAYIMDFLLLGQGALSALDARDIKTAESLFRKMSYLSGRDPLTDKGYYRFLLAYDAMLRKNFTQAAIYCAVALNQAADTGFPLAESYCHIEYAHIMHALGNHKKAVYHFKRAHGIAKMIRYRYMEFICLLTDAWFAFDGGREAAGLASLSKGLTLGRNCGYVNTYTLLPDVMAGLCCRALNAGIETEYVRYLIKKRNFSTDIPADNEDWPWPVRIVTLGGFGIERDGKPAGFARKVQQKPIIMLKALIALGGKEVKRETLSDILWPEAEGDSQHKSFAITLHRLRQMLGSENAVRLSGGRVTLNDRFCWVDIWAFEHVIGKADRALEDNDKEKAERLLEKASAMYRGPFLADDDEPFAEPVRRRLERKLIKYLKPGRL
jgi:LuxR family maltose regulon positive regulatory protein